MHLLKQVLLFLVEFCLKIAASLGAVISLAARGGLFAKILTGFRSLPDAVREIVWWIRNIADVGVIVNDYNTLTAANFNQKYGAGAINYVMDYLNEGVSYVQKVYLNLSDQPVTTILAALVVFLIFYLLARLVRFFRQEGQGSIVTRLERRAGDRVFRKEEGALHDNQDDQQPLT